MGINTIKFSDFIASSSSDATTETVGLASGVNARNKKFLIWTTATRPLLPFNGLLGFNTSLEQWEYWNSVMSAWVQLATASGTGTVNPGTTGELGYYASNGNAISGLAVSPESVLLSNTSGFPTWSGALTNGQLIIGKTGFTPIKATLTAGSGITIANGAGTITISSTTSGGTVTSISQGAGIVCTPNPIVGAGSVALAATLPANENIPQPNIIGITNGSSAAAGSVGEIIQSRIIATSSIPLSTGVTANITSIPITAGQYMLYGNVYLIGSGTNVNTSKGWISNVSATQPDRSQIARLDQVMHTEVGFSAPTLFINTNISETIYLSCNVDFGSGSVSACGYLFAQRVR